eukprot:491825-Amphidinium_carterae.1
MGKAFLLSWVAAKMKQQPPQKRSMMKRLPCRFDLQNMSTGCSAGIIHVGTRRGCEKWLPMSERDANKVDVKVTP